MCALDTCISNIIRLPEYFIFYKFSSKYQSHNTTYLQILISCFLLNIITRWLFPVRPSCANCGHFLACLSLYLYLFVCLSIYISVSLSVLLSIYLSVCLVIVSLSLSHFLSICLSLYLSVSLSASIQIL